jgi:hypothetical protein
MAHPAIPATPPRHARHGGLAAPRRRHLGWHGAWLRCRVARRTAPCRPRHLPASRGARVCGQPGRGVSGSGDGGNQNGELERLRRQYPGWRIWRGRATGGCWAMPPRGHPTQRGLIDASNADELARRLAEAERRYDL